MLPSKQLGLKPWDSLHKKSVISDAYDLCNLVRWSINAVGRCAYPMVFEWEMLHKFLCKTYLFPNPYCIRCPQPKREITITCHSCATRYKKTNQLKHQPNQLPTSFVPITQGVHTLGTVKKKRPSGFSDSQVTSKPTFRIHRLDTTRIAPRCWNPWHEVKLISYFCKGGVGLAIW